MFFCEATFFGFAITHTQLKTNTLQDRNLAHYAGYEESEMQDCVNTMLDNLKRPMKFEALFKKYSSRKFMKASIFVKGWIEENELDVVSENSESEGEDEEEEDV